MKNCLWFLIRRDQRDGYNFTQSEKSAGNYYPLVTGIVIKVRRKSERMRYLIIKFRMKNKIYN